MPSILNAMPSSPSPFTPSQPGGILRATPAHLKRTIADISSEDDSSLETDAKRRKVAFVPQPAVRVLNQKNEKKSSVIREEVRVALGEHNAGKDSELYDELVAAIEAPPADEDAPSDALLGKYMVALATNAGELKQQCSGLVHSILRLPWLDREDQLVRRYDRFLTCLASTKSSHMSAVLKMLVNNFSHITASTATAVSEADRSNFFNQLHSSIANIIAVVPSALGILSSVVSSSFPFVTDSKKAHADYVSNLLRVAREYPELKSYILDLVMDRVAKIDMQVQIDIGDLGEDVEALLADDQFQEEEEDDDNASNTDSDDSEDELDDEERRLKYLRLSIYKLDAMLDLLFDYCNPAFQNKQSDDEKTIFSILMAQFRNNLIKQYQSRHAQFLVFHFAQQSPELAAEFIDCCLNILSDKNRSESYDKVSAAAYLASFVCRAAHLDKDNIAYAFESLATFINDQRKALEPICRGPDMRRYGPYYAAVQALMYMFCFRWRTLLVDAEDGEEIDDEDLLDSQEFPWPLYIKETFSLSFNSVLNPLKVCNPLIVDQFAQMAIQLNFMFIHGKLEANKRVRLGHKAIGMTTALPGRQTASSQLHAQKNHQLDAYFPFDPYQLPTSKRWVAGDYNVWQAPPVLPGQENSDSSDAGLGDMTLLEEDEVVDAVFSDDDDE